MVLTCISCKVIFATSDLQREHYKNDWHRYNLKRKIAELPPVSKEEFDRRAASYNEPTDQEEPELICVTCHKTFASRNSILNHLKSKKHLENVVVAKTKPEKKIHKPAPKQQTPKSEVIEIASNEADEDCDSNDSDWESCDDEDEDDTSIPPTFCLFCSKEHQDIEDNVKHMTESHSFFLPDIEYLVDLKGLLTFLGHKIGNGYLCLWCDERGKSFHSVKSTQQHMIDKGHCKILHEGEVLLSYADFYDYSSSYPDAMDDGDSDATVEEIIPDDFELVLPSGAVIGHRSLFRYYKQNLLPKKPGNRAAISNVMKHYRALGWTGTTGEAAIRKARDLNFVQRLENKHRMRLGVKHNKFQPHLRPQVIF